MKYKILKSTKSFESLQSVYARIQAIQEQSKKLCLEIGGTGKYYGSSGSVTGIIIGIEFNEKPEGFKQMGERYQKIYFPKSSVKANADLIRRISEIEVINPEELNDIVGFKGPQTLANSDGFQWVRMPGIIFGKECILMEVPNKCKFIPNEDTIEILESEFVSLQELIGKEVQGE